MARRLLRWLAPVVLAGILPTVALAQASGSDDAPSKTSVLSYALALLFTLGVLVILCMPSRKS